jgi:hypothetical protein
MKKISHSKYKNTGLIFEILVRKLTNEAVNNQSPKALGILKKFFVKKELQKENKLYQIVSQTQNLSESKSEIILNTLSEIGNRLDHKKLINEKYNLVKEIRENYDEDEFFKTNIPNYKILASTYIVLESLKYKNPNINQLIESKNTLLEHLTNTPLMESEIYNEMAQLDKGERYLVYKLMLEKFNKKFKYLNPDQRLILKEYISSMSENDTNLKKLAYKQFNELKDSILENAEKVTDKVTKIKLENIITYIDPILESNKITDDNLSLLFQYQQLNEELSKVI